MPPRNIKLGVGSLYIDNVKITEITDLEVENLAELTQEYFDSIKKFKYNNKATFTFIVDKITYYKMCGLWKLVLDNCPNNKLKHFMKYGKNNRIKVKNFKRVIRILEKGNKK